MMEPITRKEIFMDAAAKGDASSLPVPVTREEMYLYIKASGDTTGILEPITRREIFWHAMCTGDASGLPDPVTREEVFLLAAAEGDASGLPDPLTREEMYLKAIAEAGGGGGGGGGDDDGGDKPFDELTWDQVIASTKTGKYKSFNVGDMKELDLGTEGVVRMQIVGIDADDLADGSGKAPLTFISKELLNTGHRMNATNTNTGGWEASEMRTYLRGTVKPLIPSTVAAQIKEVKKYSYRYNGSIANVQTTDDVWIPSWREVNLGSDRETSGPNYSTLFQNTSSRTKMKTDETSASIWWLRSDNISSSKTFSYVATDGSGDYGNASNARGIALGFCL